MASEASVQALFSGNASNRVVNWYTIPAKLVLKVAGTFGAPYGEWTKLGVSQLFWSNERAALKRVGTDFTSLPMEHAFEAFYGVNGERFKNADEKLKAWNEMPGQYRSLVFQAYQDSVMVEEEELADFLGSCEVGV